MRQRLAIVFFWLAAACGSGSSTHKPDAPPDNGFTPPTQVLHAFDNSVMPATDLGPADLSCLNTPTSDKATTVAVTLTSIVKDFQTGNPTAGAHVIAFDGIDSSTPWDTETSDADGNITFAVPAGRVRFGFEMTDPSPSPQFLPTFLVNQYLNPDPSMTAQTLEKIQTVSTSTADTLPALINQQRIAGTGVLAGALRDCQHHEIANFIATVSSTSGTVTPLAGAETYYFSASVNLPVRHMQQESSSSDGLFMAIQLPPTPTAYVQMWGFPSDADLASGQLKLISELKVPVLGDSVVTGSFEALRQ